MMIRLINIEAQDRAHALQLADSIEPDWPVGKRHIVGHWDSARPWVTFGVWRTKDSVSVIGDYEEKDL